MKHEISHRLSVTECARCHGSCSHALTQAWEWRDRVRNGWTKVNFVCQGFLHLSSDIHTHMHTYRQTDKQTDRDTRRWNYTRPLRRWSIILRHTTDLELHRKPKLLWVIQEVGSLRRTTVCFITFGMNGRCNEFALLDGRCSATVSDSAPVFVISQPHVKHTHSVSR